ncbi:MAG: transposase, partial [Tannerellaceae bacterium]|nr:transposase [Tannerellaceae bacterium]
MTGYTVEKFNELLPYFEEAHGEYLSEYQMDGKGRKGVRAYTMYANSPLPCMEERLAFILSYLKLNPIQEAHADLFDIEQKQCCQLIHGLREILHRALETAGSVPARTDAQLQDVLSGRTAEEEKILLHDGTEREIPRPQDEAEQASKYSGKKKKHTVKNAVIIGCCCMVLYVSPTFDGRVHDKKIADIAYRIPQGFTLAQDTGYQGYRPDGVRIVQPEKKPRGKELTAGQKQNNRIISSFRVRVEHAIGSI